MYHTNAIIGGKEGEGKECMGILCTFVSIFCKLGTALRNINPTNFKNLKY